MNQICLAAVLAILGVLLIVASALIRRPGGITRRRGGARRDPLPPAVILPVPAEPRRDGDAPPPGGELCDIAVLFADIRGFTTISEFLPPQQVMEILNHYFTLTSDCILRHGGTVDKFIGDSTMAIWGAPFAQPDYVHRAALAALDMTVSAAALERELRQRFGHTVSFGIGLHCGPAVVGNMGAAARMGYTAVGDTVNVAARLEEAAPPGKVLISGAVADALAGRFHTTRVGNGVHLRGRTAFVDILTLDGLEIG